MWAFQRTHSWIPRMTVSDSKPRPVLHWWRRGLIVSTHWGDILVKFSWLSCRSSQQRVLSALLVVGHWVGIRRCSGRWRRAYYVWRRNMWLNDGELDLTDSCDRRGSRRPVMYRYCSFALKGTFTKARLAWTDDVTRSVGRDRSTPAFMNDSTWTQFIYVDF